MIAALLWFLYNLGPTNSFTSTSMEPLVSQMTQIPKTFAYCTPHACTGMPRKHPEGLKARVRLISHHSISRSGSHDQWLETNC